MLQRLVRSIVSTAPRPYLIDDVPWLCSRSVIAGKSRPGKSDSMRRRNAGLIDSVSTKVPWLGHVFSTTTLPSRSKIVALISPTFSLTSDSTACSPERIRVARFAHARRAQRVGRPRPAELGHRALVALEQRRRRPFRVERLPSNLRLIAWKAGHSSLAPPVSASSTGLHRVHQGSLLASRGSSRGIGQVCGECEAMLAREYITRRRPRRRGARARDPPARHDRSSLEPSAASRRERGSSAESCAPRGAPRRTGARAAC